MNPIKQVLIVGGGTAGWLTAAFLAKSVGATSGESVQITLVESKEIGIIGVGEGTFPSIRGTLAAIGIDEARFVRECNATFKQGIKFVDWVRPQGAAGIDHYFHPFSLPSQRAGGPELLPYWLQGAAGAGVPFAEAATMQKRVADASHAPKRMDDGNFLGPMNYAYHFDAGRFATLLCEHGKSLGVKHILANVEQVELDANGAISAIITQEAGRLTADLYIDCTGFRARLIGEALGSPFHKVDDVLFADRALAVQVPYPQADTAIPSYTISTAKEAGWIWDIGLQQRRGVGYVYSSRHTDDTRAEQVLRNYIGAGNENLTPRSLKLNVGYREAQWVKNCVAVGLSGGFLEPLEASGIGLIETAAYLVSYLFPFNGDLEPVAKLFNHQMKERYERVVDFVKMHYCLSQRTDSTFWTDNTNPASIPDTLKEKLAMWRCRPPHRLDFIIDLEMYPPSSWQYVLYGMEFQTKLNANAASYPRFEEAKKEFQMIAQMSQRALANLPPHRTLIGHLCEKDYMTASKAAVKQVG
ncbi:tryptophan 7-halogenase [Undibacterium sp. RTI2.1]|uniref:tryptophan halogenase family protein n=1 Tax=unclassified Undibacterium TaxID=2630295 RepID=UPI002B22DD4B|nr:MULTISPECIES: tryptophan halogenase family protein [unclassified Undibacterium]MEB0032436.1 tryptophan 7-halogenase [Undibacterium sp. RTI2.1]MEB0115883.1 tryptophan 7-halogenase [Undibacterium sp. RTI2.2]